MLRKIKSVIAFCVTSVIALTNRGIILCFLSAILLILSFPNFNYWIFAWFSFVPLFFAINGKSMIKAFFLSFLAGFIFWLGTIYWLANVTFGGMIILALYLALYFGVFGLLISRPGIAFSSYNLLLIPSIWVIFEYIRSHLFTGFPWALLGYSQYLNLPVIQIADITGAWGVSFLVMMANVALYCVIRRSYIVHRGRYKYLLCVLFILAVLIYGYYRLYEVRCTKYDGRVKVSVIQGNIPQELKWKSLTKDFIIQKYLRLSSEAVLKDHPQLVIWPEAALPVILEEEPLYFEKAANFAKESKTPLLLGAVRLRDNIYYNSALLVSEKAKVVGSYNKLHLVPFGEYIPLRKVLPFLQTFVPIGDFTPGEEYTVFSYHGALSPEERAAFSVLICFEDTLPELSRNFRSRGVDFLVNITNDAWFGKTSAPYQHLQASVFRAVENRLFLVRAANTGVSGFIRPDGEILSLLEDASGRNIFVEGYLSAEIPLPAAGMSFYTRWGDFFILICSLFLFCGIISSFRKAQPSS